MIVMIREYRRKTAPNVYAEEFDSKSNMKKKYPITSAVKTMAFGDLVAYWFLKTPMGTVQIFNGDWIITDKNGDNYALKDSVFKIIYERTN